MSNVHVRTGAKKYENGVHIGPGQWLDVIHAANKVAPDTFGRPLPESGDWWAGGHAEEYPHARVIHRDDETVSIVGKTDEGDRILREACTSLGIHYEDAIQVLHPE